MEKKLQIGHQNYCGATNTPRYRILPSFNLVIASTTPSLVRGNFSICGLIPFLAANANMACCVPALATADPIIRIPVLIKVTGVICKGSKLTVRG